MDAREYTMVFANMFGVFGKEIGAIRQGSYMRERLPGWFQMIPLIALSFWACMHMKISRISLLFAVNLIDISLSAEGVLSASSTGRKIKKSPRVATRGCGWIKFLLVAVLTGAGVFLILTRRAVAQIEGELIPHRCRLSGGFDGDDGGEIVTLGKDSAGDQRVAIGCLGECKHGGVAPVAADDIDGLCADSHGFVVGTEKRDTDLVIGGDKKLGVGFDGGDDPATIGACLFFGVVVAGVIVTFTGMDIVVRFAIAIMIVRHRFGVGAGAMVGLAVTIMVVGDGCFFIFTSDESEGECGDCGDDCFCWFHGVVWSMEFVVWSLEIKA